MSAGRIIVIATMAAGLVVAPATRAQPVGTNDLLAILGSSVALGWNATGLYSNLFIHGSAANSYGARLTASLAADGWCVVNKSVAGDNTAAVIGRFNTDVPSHADEVLISLSLGNEGLPGSPNPQAIFNQFFSGITNLITMARQRGILPLVGGIYPRDVYSAGEYTYLKNMDLLLNTLDVPSVNFLGATDNGQGHWVSSLSGGDGLHPNDAGHYEMFLAIVPSLFDALKAGKPTPQWGNGVRFVRILGDTNQSSPLSFTPVSPVHSFSMSFRVRAVATGTVASVTLANATLHPTIEITPAGLTYVATNGQVVSSVVVATNGTWHNVSVAHQYARGLTFFYVNGVLAGTVSERLAPIGFVLGGRGNATTRPDSPTQADYKNWFVHRSMLNAEEVLAQHQGALQQSSLEIYAPLDDASFPQGGAVANRAQSLSAATINGSTLFSRVPAFAGNPTRGPAQLSVSFVDPLVSGITNWFWDFGDNTTTNVATNSVVHTYAAGVYTVTLVESGPDGDITNTQPAYVVVQTPFQSWQLQYFDCTDCPQAASTADADGDGQSNETEFLAGTNPTNGASAFAVTAIAREECDIRVTWTCGEGRTNVLQVAGDAGDGGLSSNFADIFIVTNSISSVTNYLDVGAATNSVLCYRVWLMP